MKKSVLWRIHHCIADGIALSPVLLSVTDAADPAVPARARPGETAQRHACAGLASASPARRSQRPHGKLTGAILHEGMESLAHPEPPSAS